VIFSTGENKKPEIKLPYALKSPFFTSFYLSYIILYSTMNADPSE
jgi:hypothetical protein